MPNCPMEYRNPNFNVGCVGKLDGIVVLDCDVTVLKRRIQH